jgi:hypothetical protein
VRSPAAACVGEEFFVPAKIRDSWQESILSVCVGLSIIELHVGPGRPARAPMRHSVHYVHIEARWRELRVWIARPEISNTF